MQDPDLPNIERGIYRHSKTGNLYEVLGVGLHTETQELEVVYRPLYDSKYELFCRSYDMSVEQVEIDGEFRPRFEKMDV